MEMRYEIQTVCVPSVVHAGGLFPHQEWGMFIYCRIHYFVLPFSLNLSSHFLSHFTQFAPFSPASPSPQPTLSCSFPFPFRCQIRLIFSLYKFFLISLVMSSHASISTLYIVHCKSKKGVWGLHDHLMQCLTRCDHVKNTFFTGLCAEHFTFPLECRG